MRAFVLVAGFCLAACAQGFAPESHPVTASLGGERLSVTFTDGRVCHAAVPLAGGAGRFEDCPDRGGWQAEIRKRNLLEPIFGAAVSPYGRIILTAPSGRNWVFVTPPPARHRP